MTFSPALVRVPPIRLTTVSKLMSGLPFQFRLIKENSRCSIWGEMQPAPPVSRQVVVGSELVSLPEGRPFCAVMRVGFGPA